MNLLERTHIVVDLLTGSGIDELARTKGLDPRVIEAWLQGFMEGGIAALERTITLDANSEIDNVIPLFGIGEPEYEQNNEGQCPTVTTS